MKQEYCRAIMRVCLLAHGRCCTNASELPWAAFYSSRKEESNTAFFYADSRVPCAFQAPGNKQWKNPYSIFYTRTTHVFGENPGYFLAHTVASQVWVLAEVSQRDVFRILIWNSCWYWNEELRFVLGCSSGIRLDCTESPAIKGPERPSCWAGGLQLGRVSFIWACHFLSLTSCSPGYCLYPGIPSSSLPMTSRSISHHTVTWAAYVIHAQFPSLAASLERCAMFPATD